MTAKKNTAKSAKKGLAKSKMKKLRGGASPTELKLRGAYYTPIANVDPGFMKFVK